MENSNINQDVTMDLTELFSLENDSKNQNVLTAFEKPNSIGYFKWLNNSLFAMKFLHAANTLESVQTFGNVANNKPFLEFCLDHAKQYDQSYKPKNNEKPFLSRIEECQARPNVFKHLVNDTKAIKQTKQFISYLWTKYHETVKPDKPVKPVSRIDFFTWYTNELSRQKTATKPLIDHKALHNVSRRLMLFLKKAKKRQAIITNLRSNTNEINPVLTASNVNCKFTVNRLDTLNHAVNIQYDSLKNYYEAFNKANSINQVKAISLQTFEKNLKAFQAIEPYITKHTKTGIEKAKREYKKANKAVIGKLRDYNRIFEDTWTDKVLDNQELFKISKTAIEPICGLQVISLPVAKLPSLKFYDSETNSWIDRRDVIAVSGKDSIQIKTWCKSYLIPLANNQCQLIETFQFGGKHCFRVYSRQQAFDASLLFQDIIDTKEYPFAFGICSAWKTINRSTIQAINEVNAIKQDEFDAKLKIAKRETKKEKIELAKAQAILTHVKSKPKAVKKPLCKYSKANKAK